MNFWVEYWNDTNKTDNGSHAQMKEQLHWVEPLRHKKVDLR